MKLFNLASWAGALALMLWAVNQPHAAVKPAVTNYSAGTLDLNGSIVQLHAVHVSDAGGTNDYCLGTTLQGGVAQLPYRLCEDGK